MESDVQHFPLDDVMLDSRPMTGKCCFLTFDVGREDKSNTPMLVSFMYCLW